MLYGFGISGTGAHIEQARLDNLANSLANLRTPGFKAELLSLMERPPEALNIETDDDFYKLYQHHPLLDRQGGGVQLAATRPDLRQGNLETTGNDLDLALDGQGYFVLEHSRHGRVYSRAGDFTTDRDGFLVTRDGQCRLIGDDGKPLNLQTIAAQFGVSGQRVLVADDGGISVQGASEGQILSDRRIAVVNFADGKLDKLGHTLLRTDAPPIPANAKIKQSALEMSTSDATLLMTEMVAVSRQFETNLRMLQLQDATLSSLMSNVAALPLI
ncbi:MAG: flagellar hook basal-body protein [Planctomycetes bacterium]|nr:flagellar hook basal-body protein [Planctomycetota bacterium]